MDNGTAMIVWLADGKMKYKLFDDQDKWKAEVKRIRETTPPTNMYMAAIDWDLETIESFVGAETAQVGTE